MPKQRQTRDWPKIKAQTSDFVHPLIPLWVQGRIFSKGGFCFVFFFITLIMCMWLQVSLAVRCEKLNSDPPGEELYSLSHWVVSSASANMFSKYQSTGSEGFLLYLLWTPSQLGDRDRMYGVLWPFLLCRLSTQASTGIQTLTEPVVKGKPAHRDYWGTPESCLSF